MRFSRTLIASRAVPLPVRSIRLAALAMAALAAWPQAAAAQAYTRPMVQALPDPAALRLNDALRRLAQDPRSLGALVDAGQASLSLDDVDAAEGFYRRAEGVAPGDGRVKAGLAAVLVRRLQPVEALRLFAEAEQAGEAMRFHAAERGLAYDLIGDNAKAQEQYRQFLSLGDDPLVTRRLALSQAIAGDQRGSEATLLPLLQRTDLAAYRTRAFALAILGKPDEAVSIAETMLPAQLAGRMAPYLRYMPRLTRAQQAAAANLGVFPQAAQIGRDDPALAAYVPPAVARPPARTADSRLVPSGEPLGSALVRDGIPRREEFAVPPQNGEGDQTQSGGGASPSGLVLAASPLHQPSVGPPPRAGEDTQSPEPQPEPALAAPPATVVAVLEPQQPVAAQPSISLAQPEPAAATPPAEEVDLSVAFADFSLPTRPTVAEGAVDITAITPRREAPPAPARAAPPPKPVIPSRHWVQVATGRDTSALQFDWRRIKREAGGLLDRPAPHVAAWGQTNRLVAGPFASAREADQLVARLKEKNVDSFRFTSAQGEDVKPLG